MKTLPAIVNEHDRIIMILFVDELGDLDAETLINQFNTTYSDIIDTVEYKHKLLSITALSVSTYDILSVLKVALRWIQKLDYDVQSVNLQGFF